ncbi:hypothetical protein FNT36_16650 [Hymenobacter setariae]|uniref:Uncharacterized protein n=1 Tax=Hymenobacter setariae TaxID=2594794 RepID=A0A558BS32_9BACT|nr:hypothetical protein [Hymenobacter setariae]TVT39285.1 hypothetical protein FNT36_16650 [Hymenobacter setariae]
MNFYAFRYFSPVAQLCCVLYHGTYLAQRWDDESGANLHHLVDESRGFFVEVGINDRREQAAVLRSFKNSAPLERYTQGGQLPEEL